MATRLVVEWTRTSVRMALASGSGTRARVRAIRAQPIGATGEVGEALRTLLNTVKIAGAEVVGVISREQVITRVVKFPTMHAVELSQMVELYAKAQLPYLREQTVMDFHVVSQRDGFSIVAVVACQRDVIDRHLAVLRDAGLPVGRLTISSWGVLGWYRQAIRPDPSTEPCLVVNVDETRADLVLIADGRILSSRSVGQGTQDWNASGEMAELLPLEIERSRAAIRKELPGTEVRSIIVTGLGALAPLSEPISQRLGLPVSATEAGQPFKGSLAPETVSVSPVVVAGLAGGELEGALDLSPPELRVQARHREQVHELWMVSLLVFGVLALGACLLALRVSRQQQLKVQLDQILAKLGPTTNAVQEKTRSAQRVGSVLESRRQLAQTLAGVFRATPANITLEALTAERVRKEVGVRGSAASTQDVLGYVKQLEQVEGVRDVDLKYSTRRSGPSGERMDFELTLHQQDGRAPAGGTRPPRPPLNAPHEQDVE